MDGGKPISAIIDTAAMITLINESLIPDNQLATNELIKLKGIGSQILHGRLIKGVAFAVGNLHVSWDCCAVPIDDEMILGLDFLAAYHGIVNIKECTISLENNTFPVKLISDLKQHPNSYVRIQRTMCVQPNTIVRIAVQLENHLTGEYVVSPVRLKSGLLGSHTLGRGNTTAMSFINDSSTAVKIKEGTVVGEAEAYAEICQEEESPVLIRKLQTSAQVDDELPEHLTDLYNRSTPELNDREKCRVKQLLVEYHDIFSKHDLDLGCLTSVTHKIDTKDNPPVKHKMRRTPLGFPGPGKSAT